MRGAPYPALSPLPLPPGAGGPLRAAPGGPPLERETGYQGGYIGLMVRAWRRGRALENRATTYLLGGRSRAHREAPGPIGGRCAPPPGLGVRAPPFGGALLQHRPAPPSVLEGPRTTALSADGGLSPDSRGLAAGPSYCVGGPAHRLPCLTQGAVSLGRMYGPRGPRFDPWGPCHETTKPHADADSMRSWSTPPGRLCINRAERDGPALGIP